MNHVGNTPRVIRRSIVLLRPCARGFTQVVQPKCARTVRAEYNQVTLHATIKDNLFYRGGDGNDPVTIHDTATVLRNVDLRLGDGDNFLDLNGDIGGNLRVTGTNANDTFTNHGTVGGTVRLRADGQTCPEHPHDRFGEWSGRGGFSGRDLSGERGFFADRRIFGGRGFPGEFGLARF